MVSPVKNYSRGRILDSQNYSHSLRPPDRASRYRRDEQMTAAGIEVEVDKVLEIDTILACVRVLAESMACLPLNLKKRNPDGSRVDAEDHPIQELVRWQPNEEMTAYDMRMGMMIDSLVRGSGYAQVRRDGQGRVIDLWPLYARQMKPKRTPAKEGGRLVYIYSQMEGGKKGNEVMLEMNEVLRIQVLPNGGLLSESLIYLQREAIGAAKASEQYSSEFFANGGVVSGVVEVPEEMSEAAYLRLKKDWVESHSRKGKRHGIPILEGNAKFNPIALNHEETQLLGTRKYQRSTLAGIFRVPAHMINDLEKATFSNIEHQDLNFVKHTLRPWMTNWEQRCRMTLLSKEERKTLYFKHNDRDLLRGDFPSRAEAYSLLVNCGVMSPNDAREAEDMNKYTGGDKYMVNGTLVDINRLGQDQGNPDAEPPSPRRRPRPAPSRQE